MLKHAHIPAARGGRRSAAALAASAALALTIGATMATADDAAGPDPSPVPETVETETAPAAPAEPAPEPVAEEPPAEPEPVPAQEPAEPAPSDEEAPPAEDPAEPIAADEPAPLEEQPVEVLTDSPAISEPAGPATLASDAVNYAPGETITLSGTGWPADQAITIEIRDLDTAVQTLEARTDAAGHFTTMFSLDRFMMSVGAEARSGDVAASTTFGVYEGSS